MTRDIISGLDTRDLSRIARALADAARAHDGSEANHYDRLAGLFESASNIHAATVMAELNADEIGLLLFVLDDEAQRRTAADPDRASCMSLARRLEANRVFLVPGQGTPMLSTELAALTVAALQEAADNCADLRDKGKMRALARKMATSDVLLVERRPQ